MELQNLRIFKDLIESFVTLKYRKESLRIPQIAMCSMIHIFFYW